MPQSLLLEKPLKIDAVEATSADALQMMEALDQRLVMITGHSGAAGFDPAALTIGQSVFLLARDELGLPVGCGALRPLEAAGAARVAEVKRMYAHRPGLGIGAALLARLEREAWEMGYRAIWLTTRRINQAACAFYRRHSYHDIPQYGRYVGRDDVVCLGKRLQPMKDTPWN